MIPNNEILAKHLSGMVRFPTISNADEEKMDFAPFAGLHRYLEETYPLVHQKFTREVIGPAALLYKWTCPAPKKPPLLLAAHQDVVPAGPENAWTYPPFDGVIADGFLWGRGCLDCKNALMGELEALEALIGEGFQPDFDIYLAFGCNEEVSITAKNPTARLIAQTLADRGIRIGVVLDEGGRVIPGSSMGVEGLAADIGLSEKGYADIQISKTGKAGHSARPGKPNLMADIARAVVKLDENPFPYRILPELALMYRELAPYAGERREIYEDIEKHQEEFFPLLEEDPPTAAKFHTTMAMTMAEGSSRPNVIPSRVSVSINCRILSGETVQGVLERIRKLVGGESGIQVECLTGRDPSPVSDIHNPQYQHLQKVIEDIYPGIHVLPSISTGGTDAYFYYPVADHVFRFCGENRVPQNGPGHGIDERIDISTIHATPTFFYRYLATY
jgi:carboxypeptidase PM20D1